MPRSSKKSAKPKLAQLGKRLTDPAVKAAADKKRRALAAQEEEAANRRRNGPNRGSSSKKSSKKGTAAAAGTPSNLGKQGFDFQPDDRILLVGEGNFSFAASLLSTVGGTLTVTATAYDTAETVAAKYPDAAEHLQTLADWDATVVFGVDATQLGATQALRGRRFTKILFNFPHVGAGVKDQERNVALNQNLVRAFLASAVPLLAVRDTPSGSGDNIHDMRDGIVFVTVKTGVPYDLWDVKRLGREAGLLAVKSFNFCPDQFPGYEHRRTIGFEEGLSVTDNSEITKKAPRTFAFSMEPLPVQPKKKKKSRGDDDDDDDDE